MSTKASKARDSLQPGCWRRKYRRFYHRPLQLPSCTQWSIHLFIHFPIISDFTSCFLVIFFVYFLRT